MYHHWLVAHDFEPCANSAADAAARVALACHASADDAKVVLAHVVTPPVMPMPGDVIGGGANALAAIDIMMSTSNERLEEEARVLRQQHPGLTVETVVLSGSPVEALLDHAERVGVDAIAIGSHGRTGLAHAFLGSVAERVVQKAQCPVFVIKETPSPVLAAAVA
ncbi:MAG TPA: universal stress protein [Myxococcota bacterium]